MAITACSWFWSTHLPGRVSWCSWHFDIWKTTNRTWRSSLIIAGNWSTNHPEAFEIFCSVPACLIWYLSEVADCLQPADTRQLACLQLPRRGLDWLVVWHGFLQQRLDKHQTSTLDSHMRQIRQENSVRVESQAVKYSVVKPPPISNHYYYNDYND